MRQIIIAFFCITLTMNPAQSSMIEYVPGEKSIEDIKLNSAIKVNVDKTSIKLTSFASALRRKQILIWAKVYVAEFFSSAPIDLSDGKTTLSSLSKSPWMVATLQFVRNVSNDRLIDGFTDGLKSNNHDTQDGPFKSLLSGLKTVGDLNNKDKLVLIFHTKADQDTLWVEIHRDQKTIGEIQKFTLPAGTALKMYDLWFGYPADNGIEEMQKKIFTSSPSKK